ncbi:MAG: histidinol-phosphate transaminase [Elusimicrobiota bacterium]
MKKSNFVHDRIKYLKPYTIPPVSEGEIKLDAQENPYPLPEEIKKKISGILTEIELNRYPQIYLKNLKKLLSNYAGVSEDNILIGNGSDELILLILIACGGPGKIVTCPYPAFSMYRILSELMGSKFVEISLDEEFSLPVGKILSTNPDIIFLTRPNNPTGNIFSKKNVKRIVKNSSGLVIVDEAYFEFCGDTMVKEIKDFPNLIILRTFSKAFSLAGIRAGYLITQKNLAKELRKVQLPYNISVINQKILEIIMKNKDSVLKSVEKLVSSREKLYKELKKIKGVTPYKSKANFILIRIDDIDSVMDILKKKNIKVRRFKSPGLEDYLRVTVGTEEENKNFIDAIKEGL